MRKFLVTAIAMMFIILSCSISGGVLFEGQTGSIIGGFPGVIIDEIVEGPEEPDPGEVIYHVRDNNNQGKI